MKPSDTKGYNLPSVPSEIPSSEGGYIRTERSDRNVQCYKTNIKMLRADWQRCLTPKGKPKFGPSYYAITWCEYEDEIGLTSTKSGVGKRWACKTCFNFVTPIWSDTDKCPSEDEALHEYVLWLGKASNGKKPWKKGIHGHDVR